VEVIHGQIEGLMRNEESRRRFHMNSTFGKSVVISCYINPDEVINKQGIEIRTLQNQVQEYKDRLSLALEESGKIRRELQDCNKQLSLSIQAAAKQHNDAKNWQDRFTRVQEALDALLKGA